MRDTKLRRTESMENTKTADIRKKSRCQKSERILLRRDFTINAMAYNDKDGIVDIFGGMQDLEKHMIRCVGNARERFSEDALQDFKRRQICGTAWI